MKRRRFKQDEVLEVRLTHEAIRLREEASDLKPGPKREELLRKAKLAEEGARMSEWLRKKEPFRV